MSQLLVVDDEEAICWGLARLGQGLGHKVATASSAEQALSLAEKVKPDAVVLDVRLPGMDGLTAIERLRPLVGSVPIIVITAFGDLGTAVEAVRRGAFEYLVKPFDLDRVEQVIRRALEPATPTAQTAVPDAGRSAGLVGQTPAMQEVFKRIALVAASDTGVLVHGESGTGKELVARAIHRFSRRGTNGPFVAVNVAALSESLAESELFGHVRGAFTGAEAVRVGLLAQAHKGTLFLDEVADIPLPVQVKLLRALEQGEITPVGGAAPVQVDFRVVSATHQDLLANVRAGKFRHDLYFRLCAFQIDLPALRERREDITALAEHFLSRGAPKPASLSQEALNELLARPWYGNVRELRNSLEHATILARGGVIRPEHLPPPAPPGLIDETAGGATFKDLASLVRAWAAAKLQSPDATNVYDELLKQIEPALFSAALERYHGQVAPAARALGLHRTTLKKKADDYGLGAE